MGEFIHCGWEVVPFPGGFLDCMGAELQQAFFTPAPWAADAMWAADFISHCLPLPSMTNYALNYGKEKKSKPLHPSLAFITQTGKETKTLGYMARLRTAWATWDPVPPHPTHPTRLYPHQSCDFWCSEHKLFKNVNPNHWTLFSSQAD